MSKLIVKAILKLFKINNVELLERIPKWTKQEVVTPMTSGKIIRWVFAVGFVVLFLMTLYLLQESKLLREQLALMTELAEQPDVSIIANQETLRPTSSMCSCESNENYRLRRYYSEL